MGKLHTLRRAIERDPTAWLYVPSWFQHIANKADIKEFGVRSARFFKGQWQPMGRNFGPFAYNRFVKSVLLQLGYKVTRL